MDGLDAVKIESALAAQADRQAAEDEVGESDFLTMLVAQLENQDPLNPQDSADFAAQLAQFSSVEQLIAMRAGIDTLVANAGSGAAGGGAIGYGASAIDPTNLVGQFVTVYGGQIEVDDARSPIALDYRSIETATQAEVVIRDPDGRIVHQRSILPLDQNGQRKPLEPGDHVFEIDPALHNLETGNYSIEFIAKGETGEDVTLLPMVSGLVSGAILAGEPAIRIGNRIFDVQDVLEVSVPDERTSGGVTVGGPSGGAATTAPGLQTTGQPTWNAPRAAGGV